MALFTFFVWCLTALSSGSEAQVSVSAPWTVQNVADGEWSFHHADHRAHLVLQTTQGSPGLTLVYQNRTMRTPTASGSVPLISPPFSVDELSEVNVESQGIDLFIRLAGPSLRQWTGQEEAPEEPVLTWIRVRVRGDSLRFVMTGAQRITLPASSQGPHPTPDSRGGLRFSHGFGQWRYTTDAAAMHGQLTDRVWFIDTTPSIELNQPYPKTVLDWAPTPGNPRP